MKDALVQVEGWTACPSLSPIVRPFNLFRQFAAAGMPEDRGGDQEEKAFQLDQPGIEDGFGEHAADIGLLRHDLRALPLDGTAELHQQYDQYLSTLTDKERAIIRGFLSHAEVIMDRIMDKLR